jgi:S-adenosylmethionine/arginine decarboxylase-like enzyme
MTHLHLVVRGMGRVAIGAVDAAELLRIVIDNIGMRIAAVPGNPLVYDSSVAGDEGVTVAAIIETSHCILHTWVDQEGLTLYQFDLYSCAHFDHRRVCNILCEAFDLVSFEMLLIDRTAGIRIGARG